MGLRELSAFLLALLLSIPSGLAAGDGPEGTPPLPAELPDPTQLPAPEPTEALAAEVALPDLAGHLMPPLDAGTSSTVTVLVRIGNAGAASTPSNASVMLESPSNRTLLQSFPVPALERHEQFSHEFTWEIPAGLSRLALIVDAGDELQEASETNNRATTWVHRAYEASLDATDPIRFEAMDGGPAMPPVTQLQWNEESFTLGVQATGNQSIRALVHVAWLESRLGTVALDGNSFEMVKRTDEGFYALEVAAGRASEFTFRAFSPSQAATFGPGSIDTLILEERPMLIRLASVPQSTLPSFVTFETPNGTVLQPVNPPAPHLNISFEGASHEGQGVWINKAWLAGYGLAEARFQHEDGTAIPARTVGEYYYIEPAHFSIIQVFTWGAESFESVNPQPYSEVYADGDAGFQRLVIRSDRQDPSDESLLRDFVPHQAYTLSASAGVVLQGNWQVAHPLAVGNRAERASPAANTIAPFNAMGFYYNARDCNILQSPLVVAYYRGASGTETTVWSQTGPASVGCSSQLNWNFNLRLRVTSTTTYFEFLNSAQTVLQSTGVVNTLLPTALDSIFLGSEDRCNCGYEPIAELWTDNIQLNGIAGNFVNEDFGALSTGWTYTGSAVRNSDYVRLTPASSGQVGTVRFNTPLTASRFSAEFNYRIGPDSSGADGMTFFFYKNTGYTPAGGGSMGFIDAIEPSNSGHEGYGFVLDGYQNSEYGELAAESIGIARNHMDASTRYLYYGSGIQKADGAWHTINIDVFETKVVVYQDGAYKFTYVPGGQLSRTYSAIGFSAGTGGLANYHDVDSVRISVPGSGGGSNTAPPAPTYTYPGYGNSVSSNPTLQWQAVTDPDGDPVDYAVDFGTLNPPTPYTTTSGTSAGTTTLPGTTYFWRVTSRDNRGGQTVGPVWYFTTTSAAPGLSQNFDSGSGSWSLQGLWNLESRTGRYTSSPNAAWYGVNGGTTYNNGGTNAGSMTSPSFGVPSSSPFLTFKSWHQTEGDGNYDRREVLLSTNGGSTWNCLASSYSICTDTNTAPTVSLASTMGQFNTVSISLAAFAGQTATLRFYFDTRDSVANDYEGWFVDDISVATVVNNPPNTPSSPSPTDGAIAQPTTSVTMSWTGGDPNGNSVTSTVYFGTTNPPTTVQCTTLSTTCATGTLVKGTTYYWRVRASDGIAAPVDGPVWNFMTNRNPNIPSSPSPIDGATNVAWNPTVSWSGGDPDGQTVTYQVYRRQGTTGSFSLTCNGSPTSCAWTGLTRGATYQWYVVASDTMGASVTGPTWTFTAKANTAPPAPTNPTPADGATNQLYSLTLAWSTGTDIDGDTLTRRVYTGTTNPPTTLRCGPSTTMTTCAWSGLARGVTHYWKVELQDGFGGVSSSTWSFTTKPNSLPTTCLSLNSNYLEVTATNPCLDPDGDAVTYTFNWGDGTPNTVIGPTTSFPNVPAHLYGINYCPSGTASVTMTANDGYGTANQGATRAIADTRDDDVDGLLRCREVHQGTSDNNRDTDGDDLGNGPDTNGDLQGDGIVLPDGRRVYSDYVESQWFEYRNVVFCPAAAPAATCAPNPRHKDIYIELDWMGTSDHVPSSTVLAGYVTEYAGAAVSNPDGVNGITLHLDVGSLRGAAYNYGGGNSVTHQTTSLGSDCGTDLWENFDDIKGSATGMAAAKVPYYRYGLLVHATCPGAGGISRGYGDRDFIMNAAHGSDNDWDRNTFLHEFGHAMGLTHGGGTNFANEKPNYLSLMNYRWPYKPDPSAPTDTAKEKRYIGYSTFALDALSESNLNEDWGLNPLQRTDTAYKNYLNGFRVHWTCPLASAFPAEDRRRHPHTGFDVDWDCDAVATEASVVANINGRNQNDEVYGSTRTDGSLVTDDCTPTSSAKCETLLGYNDWAIMRFNGQSRNYGYGQFDYAIHADSFEGIVGRTCTYISLTGDTICTR